MALDVDRPDPPDLTNRELPTGFDPDASFDSVADLRRGELETALRDGAWSEAFREWATYTDLTAAEFRLIDARGLFADLDFYWDPAAESLEFEVPELPDGRETRDDFPPNVRSELTDLCRTVIETLEDGYVEWGQTAESENVWEPETFDEDTRTEN